MAGSKARFNLDQAITDYLKPGSDEFHGVAAFADGETLDVNVAEDKAHLKGACSGFRKIAEGIERDAHLNRRLPR